MNRQANTKRLTTGDEFRQAVRRIGQGAIVVVRAVPWKPAGKFAINTLRYGLGALVFVVAIVPFKIFTAILARDSESGYDRDGLALDSNAQEPEPGQLSLDAVSGEVYHHPVPGSITTDGRTVGLDGRLY